MIDQVKSKVESQQVETHSRVSQMSLIKKDPMTFATGSFIRLFSEIMISFCSPCEKYRILSG